MATALAAPALAADLAARPYTKAPVIASIHIWRGFYIGPTAPNGRDRGWPD